MAKLQKRKIQISLGDFQGYSYVTALLRVLICCLIKILWIFLCYSSACFFSTKVSLVLGLLLPNWFSRL